MRKIRFISLLIFGLLTISCNSQTQKMTEKEFTEIYYKSIKERNPQINYRIEKDLVIKSEYQDKEFTHFLDNAYAEYTLEPDSLKEVIDRYSKSSLNLYKEKLPINTNRIVPIIKPNEYLDEIKALTKSEDVDDHLVYERYNDELIIVYAEDTEQSIQYFSNDDFLSLNIQKDTLRNFAIQNLLQSLPDIQRHGDSITYMITVGGDYEASLILFDFLWSKENISVDGDFVIGIPNRDLLFVTGSNTIDEINRLKGVIENSYKTGDHQVSPYLYILRNDKFERYE